MPHVLFVVKDAKVMPGTRSRLACFTPFVQQALHPQYRTPMFNPHTRQPMMMLDDYKTFAALQQAGYFPPHLTLADVDYWILDHDPKNWSQLNVYCESVVPVPTVQPANVNAPYANPVGNRGTYNGAPAPAPQDVPTGAYEQLQDHALPGNDNPMFGMDDGFGGAYTETHVGANMQYNEQRIDTNTMAAQGMSPEEYKQKMAQNPQGQLPPLPKWRNPQQ